MNEIVAIIGSRNYPDLNAVIYYVCSLPPDTVVVTGMARGVDMTARTTALGWDLFVVDVPVTPKHWERFGKRAGPYRNAIIAQICTRMVAFWDGTSRGTKSAIDAAKALGKPVEVKTLACREHAEENHP